MAATFAGVVAWIFKWAAIIFGLLLAIYIISLIPLGPLQALASGLLNFLAWIFGDAAPRLGGIILDRIAGESGGPPPTTTIP